MNVINVIEAIATSPESVNHWITFILNAGFAAFIAYVLLMKSIPSLVKKFDERMDKSHASFEAEQLRQREAYAAEQAAMREILSRLESKFESALDRQRADFATIHKDQLEHHSRERAESQEHKERLVGAITSQFLDVAKRNVELIEKLGDKIESRLGPTQS